MPSGWLPDRGRVIRPEPARPRVTDGPFIEAKEAMGGFYLIEAANYDEAVARAMDHPHLAHGGSLEIRQLHDEQ
jgi:hypothetical protein